MMSSLLRIYGLSFRRLLCDSQPDAMGIRRQTAEHPFGTIKCWIGATHFLTKKLPELATETALNVLAYNMKPVTGIAGVGGLLEAMRA
jgi:hypothetical protein